MVINNLLADLYIHQKINLLDFSAVATVFISAS